MEFLIWFLLAVLVGVYANSKGRSGIGFTLLSLFLTPIIGIIIALIVAKKEDNIVKNGDAKKCPHCKELVKVDALTCKHCGKDIVKSNSTYTNPRSVDSFYKNSTYFINISNYADNDFEKAKESLSLQYGPKGYDTVSADSEAHWKLTSSTYKRSYIQILINNSIMKIEVYNVQEEPRLLGNTPSENRDSQKQETDNTDKLIELSKLLEKGLLTEQEFQAQKQKLL